MIISLPEASKTAGVYFSGGVESTLLYYLLMKQYQGPIQPIAILQPNVSKSRLLKISEWICTSTGKESLPIYDIFPNPRVEGNLLFTRWAHHLLSTKIIDVLFVGGNPYSTEVEDAPQRQYLRGTKIYQPFDKLYKDEILTIYKSENIMPLLDFTHSCSIDPNNSCNYCFNCRERFWAFQKMEVANE